MSTRLRETRGNSGGGGPDRQRSAQSMDDARGGADRSLGHGRNAGTVPPAQDANANAAQQAGPRDGAEAPLSASDHRLDLENLLEDAPVPDDGQTDLNDVLAALERPEPEGRRPFADLDDILGDPLLGLSPAPEVLNAAQIRESFAHGSDGDPADADAVEADEGDVFAALWSEMGREGGASFGSGFPDAGTQAFVSEALHSSEDDSAPDARHEEPAAPRDVADALESGGAAQEGIKGGEADVAAPGATGSDRIGRRAEGRSARGFDLVPVPQRVLERIPQPAEPKTNHDDPLEQLLNLGPARRRRKKTNRWFVRGFWALLIAGLVYLAFLPYSFEVGGEFVVQPMDRAEVRARTDGEIVESRVQEGDWVRRGDVLATMSNWEELREIAMTEAELAKLVADLETLTSGATVEEIGAAEKSVETARVKLEIAQNDHDRQAQLVAAEVAPARTLLERADDLRLAQAALAEAEATLAVIKSDARVSEIKARQAAIDRTEEDRAYARQQLEHTKIRATVSGQVVSTLDDVPLGAFLPEGGLFAELQDNRTVVVEIEVPETEIEEVQIGAQAELRPWSAPEDRIFGTVQRITPAAQPREFGNVVRVLVEVPNADGRLASNMTGYAKIDAEDRPVWQAFTRVFVRFFEVEMWSWLP